MADELVQQVLTTVMAGGAGQLAVIGLVRFFGGRWLDDLREFRKRADERLDEVEVMKTRLEALESRIDENARGNKEELARISQQVQGISEDLAYLTGQLSATRGVKRRSRGDRSDT